MRTAWISAAGATVCATGILLAGCGDSGGTGGTGGTGGGATVSTTATSSTTITSSATTTATSTTSTSATSTSANTTTATTSTGMQVVCGDGVVGQGESCDDGGTANGDGCSATCAIEHGFQCTGMPSVCTATCGDGLIASPVEGCDDGGTAVGDGCSATCQVEHGYSCMNEPSVCMTGCGDGIIAGSETCDDGNMMNGDGCNSACAVESGYQCSGMPSVCAIAGTCASPIVVTGTGFVFQAPNLDMYGDDLANTDASCKQPESGTGHPDVVFQVTLHAGETLQITDSGAADVLFHVLNGACSSASTCKASYDGGQSGEMNPGLVYKATADETDYVVIDSWKSMPPSTDNVDLLFNILSCGDGVVSGAIGEGCDDGGTANGDGCSSTCQLEPGYDCTGTPSVCTLVPAANCATPIIVTGNSFVYSGSSINAYGNDQNYSAGSGCHSLSGTSSGADIVFMANLTAGQTVLLRQLGPLDSVLDILGGGLCAGGTACVASTDLGEVAGISYTASTAGPVYLVVEAWGNPTTPPAGQFEIHVDISTCGDGIIALGEACDDGNMGSGDGCSSTCTIEPGFICSGTPSTCANIGACTTATCALGGCTGTVVTGVASGVPAAIPDDLPNGGAVLTIPIVATGNITKMAMGFGATHTYDGDLDVRLTGPNGGGEQDISLGNGSSGDNYTGTIFRSGASSDITSGTAPFTGVFAPETDLATFNGQSVTGTWTLRVDDHASGDTGTVDHWDVAFCVTP